MKNNLTLAIVHYVFLVVMGLIGWYASQAMRDHWKAQAAQHSTP